MRHCRETLTFHTPERVGFVNITPEVEKIVAEVSKIPTETANKLKEVLTP